MATETEPNTETDEETKARRASLTLEDLARNVDMARKALADKQAEVVKYEAYLQSCEDELYDRLGPRVTPSKGTTPSAAARETGSGDDRPATPKKDLDADRVVKWVEDQGEWVSAAQIAEALGYVPGTPFSGLLRDLTKPKDGKTKRLDRDGNGPRTVYKGL